MKVKNLFKEKKKSARTKRLAKSRYQRQNIANELVGCREKRLFNQRQYQKEKIKNESQFILDKRDWQIKAASISE